MGADTKKMTDTQRTLKQMILEGMYVVDERSVAGAIMARAQVRTAVARAGFRGDSFPLSPDASAVMGRAALDQSDGHGKLDVLGIAEAEQNRRMLGL